MMTTVVDEDATSRAAAQARADQTGVRCPTCGHRAAWTDNAHRPFCSLTCRLIDPGEWPEERHRIEGDLRHDPA